MARLHGLSFQIDIESIFSAPVAARRYLQQHDLRPYLLDSHPVADEAIVEPGELGGLGLEFEPTELDEVVDVVDEDEEHHRAGIELVEEQSEQDVVLVDTLTLSCEVVNRGPMLAPEDLADGVLNLDTVTVDQRIAEQQHADLLALQRESFDWLVGNERWAARVAEALTKALDGFHLQRTDRAVEASLITLAMVAVVALGWMSMLNASLLATGAMIATGCLTLRTAARSIDWGTLVVIACAIGLESAVTRSGLAEQIAGLLTGVGRDNPYMALAAVFVGCSFMTNVITNNAAAAFMFPIAYATAQQLGVSKKTVSTYRQRIYDKLGVNDRAAAVAAAYERGIITPGELI